MAFQQAALEAEVPHGHTKYVKLGATAVILANWEGQIHALSGTCPHQRYPLEGACVWKYLLECPWHHFQFDIRTGENHYPRNVYPPSMTKLQDQVRPLNRYAVAVRDDAIWVDVEQEAAKSDVE